MLALRDSNSKSGGTAVHAIFKSRVPRCNPEFCSYWKKLGFCKFLEFGNLSTADFWNPGIYRGRVSGFRKSVERGFLESGNLHNPGKRISGIIAFENPQNPESCFPKTWHGNAKAISESISLAREIEPRKMKRGVESWGA